MDLNRRTFADKVLGDKTFNIAKDPKYDGYQHGFTSMVYKSFEKQSKKSAFKKKAHLKRKAYLPFINNIWCGDLADMQLISKCNERFRFLFCVINIYSKYAWVIPLKDKKGTTITNLFKTS